MSGRLDGRVVVVTGAGSGIGAGSARALAADGATVACADLDLARAEATAKELGGGAFAVHLDVTDKESNDAAAAAVVSQAGRVDAAHINAGVASVGAIFDITLEEWDRCNDVNLRGALLGMQAFGKAMRDSASGGSIIVTSSGAGLNGGQSMGTYCATKFGVIGLVKCAAADLAPFNIRVNAVCPGFTYSNMNVALQNDAAFMEQMKHDYVTSRLGYPEDVAYAVLYLASDEAPFTTGAALVVDGGHTIK